MVPKLISGLTVRHGWDEGRPGFGNFAGLLLVVAGGALLIWVMGVHVVRIPERVRVELRVPWKFTPPCLVENGPYRFTRHPMYVAILALWCGWAVFYGSAAVSVGCLILAIVINVVARQEERVLEDRFGKDYRQYRRSVPRWLGLRHLL